MKKLLKIVAVAALVVSPFVFGGSAASAQTFTCEVGYTGPNSNNQCESKVKYTCDVKNDTDVTINVDGQQEATSGNVNNSGNTGTGNSTSGTVTNSNGTNYTVVITNPTVGQGTCFATAVVPATPVTPVTPATPVQPTQGGGAAALPKTNGDATSILMVVAGSLAALTALGVGGVALYRYYKSL